MRKLGDYINIHVYFDARGWCFAQGVESKTDKVYTSDTMHETPLEAVERLLLKIEARR